ncbi:MAG: methyltransferase, partial [Chlamydiota bacterium]|nr:methyltransferase [Chlamydiota bacterium]
MMTLKKDPGSFRDRNGRIFYSDGDVFRALSKKGHEQWLFLKSSACINAFLDAGSIVKTEEVNLRTNLLPNEWEAVLKHERVPFISYPYEWSFDMMKDAALFQLELLQAALDEGLILKDATPYNIQWKGTRPVFIDVLSFEKYLRGEPWVAYQQFCR